MAIYRFATLFTGLMISAVVVATETPSAMPALPDKEGFAGMYAGVSHGALLAAGGANFPDKKPWQGGEKVWHDDVFVLDKPDGTWRKVGKLPRPLGYGVSVSHNDTLVCVGGSHQTGHSQEAFRLEWRDGKLVTSQLPDLPRPLANMAGALDGDTLFIACGQLRPDGAMTTAECFSIDLSQREPSWTKLEDCPGGGRMLPTAACHNGQFYLVGGVELKMNFQSEVSRKYLSDGYCYTPGKGWAKIAELPYPVAAAPSPAPTDKGGFFLLGGDDGSQVSTAPDRHPGFRKRVLRYEPKANKWHSAGALPAGHVTAPMVFWQRQWLVVSGEVRPGVR